MGRPLLVERIGNTLEWYRRVGRREGCISVPCGNCRRIPEAWVCKSWPLSYYRGSGNLSSHFIEYPLPPGLGLNFLPIPCKAGRFSREHHPYRGKNGFCSLPLESIRVLRVLHLPWHREPPPQLLVDPQPSFTQDMSRALRNSNWTALGMKLTFHCWFSLSPGLLYCISANRACLLP